MSTIAHISDLHFGSELPEVAEALLKDLHRLAPTVVVVSGDLTQRATAPQFRAAAEYLRRIPFPQIVVPGNHDISLFNLYRRFSNPLKRYRKFITKDLFPEFRDSRMFVLGVNTARSFTWKGGRISREQIRLVKSRMCRTEEGLLKVLVTHHNIIPPLHQAGSMLGRATQLLHQTAECGLDLLLAGHLHRGYTDNVRRYYIQGRSILVAQAGTAISGRLREEPNSYNVIHRAAPGQLTISLRVFQDGKFIEQSRNDYRQSGGEWQI